MRGVLAVTALLFATLEPVRAQETPARVAVVSPAGQELPNSPAPKIEPGSAKSSVDPNAIIENSPCPGGIGKPCALLGGRVYFPDLWHMTEHDRTWGDAMRHPQMLFAAALLVGTTAFDIEGTDHCLHLHECREANPIMPKFVDRAWQYPLAMSLNGLAIYGAGRLKQRGRGNRAFVILIAASVAHSFFGAEGFTVAEPVASPTGTTVKPK